jgi:hypothetical protein
MISEEHTGTAFAVVELRRYAMQPGKRDTLIALFERGFIEAQERCGMVPFGHYRDLDDPDAYVWFRGFPQFEARRDALERFYGSATWFEHREAANATLLDTDNVLLLRNARPDSSFDLEGLVRPGAGAAQPAGQRSLVAVSIFMLDRAAGDDFVSAFEARLLPTLRTCAQRIAYLVTEERPNAFPRHPVREREFAFVVGGVCETPAALESWTRAAGGWSDGSAATLERTTLRLEPAARSLFR